MEKKVYKKRVSASEFVLNVEDPFLHFKNSFERDAKLAMNVNHLYWIPVLDEKRNLIEIEFIAEGTKK